MKNEELIGLLSKEFNVQELLVNCIGRLKKIRDFNYDIDKYIESVNIRN